MCVEVGYHGRFFGEVFGALTGHFEACAMVGVDGGFGEAEGVGVVEGELGAKEFCCSRKNLSI